MAITAAICNSYKQEIMQGVHEAADTYKIALYTSAATLGASTTVYTSTNEVANGSGYTTGGATLAGFAVTIDTNTAVLDFTTDPTWPTSTSSLGVATAIGVGNALPSGLSSSATAGYAVGKGRGIKLVTAPTSSTSSIGSATAGGKGRKVVSGLGATITKDSDIAKGKATKAIVGLGATSSVGTPPVIVGKGRAIVVGVSTGGGEGGEPVISRVTQKVYFDSRNRISRVVKTITQDI